MFTRRVLVVYNVYISKLIIVGNKPSQVLDFVTQFIKIDSAILVEPHVLAHEDLVYQLQTRGESIAKTAEKLWNSCEAQLEGLTDRYNYVTPLFGGLRGIGKTALLEHYKDYLTMEGFNTYKQSMNIDEYNSVISTMTSCREKLNSNSELKILYVLLAYGNGLTPYADEYTALDVVTSFCFRALYQVFVKGKEISLSLPQFILLANGHKLTVDTIVTVIYEMCPEYNCVYFGIDDYQNLQLFRNGVIPELGIPV